jgi:hypothetical protein
MRGSRAGMWLALLNALVIATYTLIDGIGCGAPARRWRMPSGSSC